MAADDSRGIQNSSVRLLGAHIDFKTSAAQFIALVPLKAISVINLRRVHLNRRRTAHTVHEKSYLFLNYGRSQHG